MTSTAQATAAVATAFAALEAGVWATFADLTAPAAMEQLRAREVAHLLAWAEYIATREKTGAGGYGSNAIIRPELLAQYGSVRLEWAPGSPTIEAMAALQPREFFTTWLPLAHGPSRLRPPMPAPPRFVLGGVSEREGLVHVIYRGVGWIPIEQVQIMPVTFATNRWLLLLNDDVLRPMRPITPNVPVKRHPGST